jgi:acyl-CoA thioesterase-1
MRRAFILTGTLVITAGCGSGENRVADSVARAPQPAASVTDRRTIVFAGTSLTAGLGLDPDSAYPRLLQAKLDSAGFDFESVNAGVSGETTAGLLQRLDWLLRGKFDVFVIESGANDGLRGVPVEAIEANLRHIIRRVREARPQAIIALVQMEALPNYGRSYGTAFHDLYVRVAREEKVALLPFLLENVAGRAELNQGDGIHPNIEGERLVAENLWRGLRRLLPAP